jgi:hypothetical protein
MVFSLEHDIKVTKNHQNLLPTQSVLVAHTVFTFRLQDRCSSTQPDWFDSQFDNQLSNDICT